MYLFFFQISAQYEGLPFNSICRLQTEKAKLTLRLLMSYIYIYIYIYTHTYGAHILDVSRSHTTTHHSR